MFQFYYQAKYINEIAAAGKAEFPIPCYINVWLDYPPAELPQRQMDMPGIGYPSGGAVQKLVGLWRALAPSMDVIAPDIYSDDSQFYRETMRAYNRPDNPLLIPGTGRSDTLPNSSSTRSEAEPLDSRLSESINRVGTFLATSPGRRTRATLNLSPP